MKPSALALLLATAGCASHGTELKSPARKVPTSFPEQSAGPSVARVNWRQYFGDDHLNELIGGALSASPDIFIALQRIEMARAGVKQATGATLPEVSARAGAGVQKVGRYTPEGAGNATTEITPGRPVPTNIGDFAVGLESSWELDAWGKLRNQRGAALALYLASVEGARLVVTTLVADIAAAYYELLALDHAEDVLSQTVVRQQEALEVVRLQKEAGRANELAVQQFEAQLASTRALEAETALGIARAENLLNLLGGRYPGPIARAKEALFADTAPAVATGVPSEMLANRPDIRMAEQRLRATECDVGAARAAFFPNITISAGVGFQAFNPKFLLSIPESLVYSASVGLVAPLVNRSAIEAQFEAAKASQLEAMYDYQKVILAAYVDVANGMTSLAASSKIVALKQMQRAALEQTVDAADILYRAGKASYFEVLIAQQNTLAAQLELIDALKAAHVAKVRIYKALGGGWR